MGHTFASKLGQMPHLFPTIAQEGVVGHNIDRCIRDVPYRTVRINVMPPHYHRYELRWGRWRFASLKLRFPITGEALAMQPLHTPDKSPSSKTQGQWRIRDFVFQLSVRVGFIMSYSIQETLRLALALAFVHRFHLMLQIPTTSSKYSDQFATNPNYPPPSIHTCGSGGGQY